MKYIYFFIWLQFISIKIDDKAVWLSQTSNRITNLNNQIKYLNIKWANTLDEYYKKLARDLFSKAELLVVEQLNSKEMRANKTGKTLVKVDSYKTTQRLSQGVWLQ